MNRVAVFVCLLALVPLIAAQSTAASDLKADIEMSILPTVPTFSSELVPDELVNGAFAINTISQQKGLKVNGGIAAPAPSPPPAKVHSNADCAGGHIVNGKCLRIFPKPARKANENDNMESPEQLNHSAFEPDIHQFVKKHFGQDVMEETPSQSHLAGLPGPEIIDFEMNKNSNALADDSAASLLPIGSEMMKDGDSEVNVNIVDNMNTPTSQILVFNSGSHNNNEIHALRPAGAPSTPTTSTTSNTPSTTSATSTSVEPAPSTVDTSATSSQTTSTSGTNSDGSSTPVVLSDGQQEVAEPRTTVIVASAPFEDVDVESSGAAVDEEPGLPPTPTPTPTPDPEIIARERAEAEKRAQEVAACYVVLEREGMQCTNTPSEKEAMSAAASLLQTDINTTAVTSCDAHVKLVNETFDAKNIRENLHSWVLFCTDLTARKVAENNISHSASVRAQFAQKLVRYASVLSCLDSEDFPGCVPEEAVRTVRSEPVDGLWVCF